MNCSKCGMFNNDGNKFCVKCGSSLDASPITPENQNIISQQIESSFQENTSETTNDVIEKRENDIQVSVDLSQSTNVSSIANASVEKMSITDYFLVLLDVILKPFTVFKEKINKFSNFKNSAIMALLVSGAATILKLISSMISVVIVKTYSWSSDGYETKLVFENLKYLDYFELIAKNFLIYLCVIAAVAGIYYLAGLVAKKQTNFSRLLGVSTLVFVPMFVCLTFLSSILSLIWIQLAVPIIMIGIVYTFILLYEGMNLEISLDGNKKYYFNLICISLLLISVYFLYLNIIVSAIIE